ncbi:MAG: hypothetical protein NTY66_02150 [Candidatus Vogelbacteria bacterium]|nr:hypothetical protein [Candidatus Vogelbacteria bacterium]
MDLPDQKKEEDIKELLEADIELNKENNEMLKGMARSARWGLIFSVVKWAIIIGGALGVYYYFGQMFESVYGQYNNLLGKPVNTSTGAGLIQNKVEQFKNAIKNI